MELLTVHRSTKKYEVKTISKLDNISRGHVLHM